MERIETIDRGLLDQLLAWYPAHFFIQQQQCIPLPPTSRVPLAQWAPSPNIWTNSKPPWTTIFWWRQDTQRYFCMWGCLHSRPWHRWWRSIGRLHGSAAARRWSRCGSTIDRQRHRQRATEPASKCHPPAGINLHSHPLCPLRCLSLTSWLRHNGCGPSTTDQQGRQPPSRAANPCAPSVLPPLSILEQSNEERMTQSWRLDERGSLPNFFLAGRTNHNEQIG